MRDVRDRYKIDYPIALDETGSAFKGLGLPVYPNRMFAVQIRSEYPGLGQRRRPASTVVLHFERSARNT